MIPILEIEVLIMRVVLPGRGAALGISLLDDCSNNMVDVWLQLLIKRNSLIFQQLRFSECIEKFLLKPLLPVKLCKRGNYKSRA